MEDGNPAIDRVALVDQIRALDKLRLRKRAGYLSQRAIFAILHGFDYMVGRSPTQISN
jgi:mRNA-degrading endonuclease toxin of MazEF toxin-antitoxin module